MNPNLGWALAFAALVAGWYSYRWHGVVLAITLIAFWLLLQFNRSVRVMRAAAESPLGRVDSAVMLQAKLQTGMTMLQIVKLSKSLGRHLGDAPETWGWDDASGAAVKVELDAKGRCVNWTLTRPAETDAHALPAEPPSAPASSRPPAAP